MFLSCRRRVRGRVSRGPSGCVRQETESQRENCRGRILVWYQAVRSGPAIPVQRNRTPLSVWPFRASLNRLGQETVPIRICSSVAMWTHTPQEATPLLQQEHASQRGSYPEIGERS